MELGVLCDINIMICVFDPKMSKATWYSTLNSNEIMQKAKEIDDLGQLTRYEPVIELNEDVKNQQVTPFEHTPENDDMIQRTKVYL